MLDPELATAVEEKRMSKLPYEHYKAEFKNYDPLEMSEKSTCPYNAQTQLFTVKLMGQNYQVKYPEGSVIPPEGTPEDDYKPMTMILRYLMNAKGEAATGVTVAYRDVPGGNHYFKSFEGRCLKRFAFTFNYNVEGLKRAMEKLGAEVQKHGDLSYRFEFINNIYLTVILWMADEEFPPESQILFDKNITSGFDAEDMAVMGDVFIPVLKKLAGK